MTKRLTSGLQIARYGVDRVTTLASSNNEDADFIAWNRLSNSGENAKVKARENVEGGKSPALPSFLPFYFGILEPGTNQHYRHRSTQREFSSKPLKHSIVERILVFQR